MTSTCISDGWCITFIDFTRVLKRIRTLAPTNQMIWVRRPSLLYKSICLHWCLWILPTAGLWGDWDGKFPYCNCRWGCRLRKPWKSTSWNTNENRQTKWTWYWRGTFIHHTALWVLQFVKRCARFFFLFFLQICLYNRNIFMGYLNEPEKTLEAFDEDGWMHSGDLGKFDDKSCLRICGRIKVIS